MLKVHQRHWKHFRCCQCLPSLGLERSYSSNSQGGGSAAFITYVQLLHKRFKKYVHPDFFTATPKLREVNAANLLGLQTAVDALSTAGEDQSDHGHESSSNSGSSSRRKSGRNAPRSLVFYIKAGALQEQPAPRKVKVSLKRLTQSLREILEDYESELPPEQKSYDDARDGRAAQGSSAFRASRAIDLRDLLAFLDDLTERRELLAWREARKEHMRLLSDELQAALGVESIDLRYSWSAQSNAKMFSSLLTLLAEVRESRHRFRRTEPLRQSETMEFLSKQSAPRPSGVQAASRTFEQGVHYPWSGLTLVFTPDDCTNDPVSAVEGEVQLCPSHVKLQWLEALTAVDAEVVSTAVHVREELVAMQKRASSVLSAALVDVLTNNRQQVLAPSDRKAIASSVRVRVRRGFTCSKTAYGYFLTSLLAQLPDELPPGVLQQDKPTGPDLGLRIGSERRDAAGVDQKVAPSAVEAIEAVASELPTYHEAESALLASDSLWMTQLPLVQDIVVERGHGTKILESGDLRVCATVGASAVVQLLERHGLIAIKRSALQKRQRYLVSKLSQDLCAQLGVLSITRGVGVSEAQFYDSLEDLRAFLEDPTKNAESQRLYSLRGLSVRVGMYLGLGDDGSVILPHGLLREHF